MSARSPSRRQFLQALGLGAVGASLPFSLRDEPLLSAGAVAYPKRIVFFVTPHGHVWPRWNMAIPGGSTTQVAERSLVDLPASEFSDTLRPLHPFRDRLLAIEGLSRTTVLQDLAEIVVEGGDVNNHTLASAGLLTCVRALQRPGLECIGGGISLDQLLAQRTGGAGRFSSRVYGSQYAGGISGSVTPFSLLGAGQPTPAVFEPGTAFSDLMGYLHQPSALEYRAAQLQASRTSVLDKVAAEYAWVANQQSSEGRLKLEQHRSLVRDLEQSLTARDHREKCNVTFDSSGHVVSQFMNLIRLAFSCDLTRVVLFTAPVPACPDFGYPATSEVHIDYAHSSVDDGNGGAPFSLAAEQAMTDLNAWYARHFANLLQELDSVQEGDGTLLDHTIVVWLSELATPTHQHRDACNLIAGGSDSFRLGRYIRYPRHTDFPQRIEQRETGIPLLGGPAQSHLYVSLLRAMGQEDNSFGMTQARTFDGNLISLTGGLRELHHS